MRNGIKLTFLALFCAMTASAQEMHFTQKNVNPMFINPAMAGIQGVADVGIMYRNQWEVFHTSNLFYSQQVDFLNGGIGFQVKDDRTDIISQTNISALYAPSFKITEDLNFRFGLDFGIGTRSIHKDRLIFIDSSDPVIDALLPTITFPDLSAGFVFSGNRWYGGLAADHLNKPDLSFSADLSKEERQNYKFTFHGGGFVPLQEEEGGWLLNYYAVFEISGGANIILPGIGISKGVFTGGLSTRRSLGNPNLSIFNALAGVNFKRIKVGYSYDFGKTPGGMVLAAHEISLVVHLGKKKESYSPMAGYFQRVF